MSNIPPNGLSQFSGGNLGAVRCPPLVSPLASQPPPTCDPQYSAKPALRRRNCQYFHTSPLRPSMGARVPPRLPPLCNRLARICSTLRIRSPLMAFTRARAALRLFLLCLSVSQLRPDHLGVSSRLLYFVRLRYDISRYHPLTAFGLELTNGLFGIPDWFMVQLGFHGSMGPRVWSELTTTGPGRSLQFVT